MNYKNLIDELQSKLLAGEERYSNLALKELDRGNIQGMAIMQAQATVWTQVRYVLEELLEKYNEE